MKLTRFLLALAFSFIPLTGLHAQQQEHVAPIRDYLDLEVQSWLTDETLIDAINAQNEDNANLSEEDINALDAKWREEISAGSKPMIEEVLARPVSEFLRGKQDDSVGLISEVFVMDAKGLNVGQSAETSDYWQGDEDKWQKTFLEGPDAVFIDAVEVDDSSGAVQSQASLPIIDPDTGEVIGAITLGFNLDSL